MPQDRQGTSTVQYFLAKLINDGSSGSEKRPQPFLQSSKLRMINEGVKQILESVYFCGCLQVQFKGKGRGAGTFSGKMWSHSF